MPRPFDILPPRLDHLGQAPQTAGIQTRTLRQYHLRVKKKLRLSARALNVDMRRLSRIALVGVEEEAKAGVRKRVGKEGGKGRLGVGARAATNRSLRLRC